MLELPLEWDAELLGGLGDRNNRRGLLARRILRHGLLVQRMELWYGLLLTFTS